MLFAALIFLQAIAAIAAASSSNSCRLAGSNGYLNTGISTLGANPSPFATNTGILRAAMLFVDFDDAPANDTIASLYDILMPGVADFYDTASYGRLNVSVQVDKSRFYRMPRPSTFYRIIRNDPGMQQDLYIQDALAAAIQQGSEPWTSADVLWIIPTRKAEKIELSPTSLAEYPLPGDPRVVFRTAVTVGQDLHWKWARFGGWKLLNHETSHSMGLPDLYPGDNFRQSKTKPLRTGEWVGGFDVMGLINGSSPDYFAWHKWKLGWLDDVQVACISTSGAEPTKVRIQPLEVPGGIKAAAVRLSKTKAFVLEVRTNRGVNAGSCSTGLVPYIIDTAAQNYVSPPIQVLNMNVPPGAIEVPGCEPDRGGPLTSAAINLERSGAVAGAAAFTSREHGVSFTVDAINDGAYEISISWKGVITPVTQPKEPWPLAAGVGPIVLPGNSSGNAEEYSTSSDSGEYI